MVNKEKQINCILKNKLIVAKNTVTLRFGVLRGKLFAFEPGQYVVVNLKDGESNFTAGKMYTISSVPNPTTLDITVRKIGFFSSALCDLSVGDMVSITGPYGELYPKEDANQLVFIAGGIGITPFYSIIKQYVRKKDARLKQLTILYSNRAVEDAVFLKELRILGVVKNGLKIVNTFTRESVDKKFGERGRIDEKLIKKYVKNSRECTYFICGSIDFSDSMWRILNNMSVPENKILIETFY